MSYKLSTKAEDDLVNVYLEGLPEYGPERAESYLLELECAVEKIGENPKLYRERQEITPPVRVRTHKAHIIIYLIDDDGIPLILRIRHGHEDWVTNPA